MNAIPPDKCGCNNKTDESRAGLSGSGDRSKDLNEGVSGSIKKQEVGGERSRFEHSGHNGAHAGATSTGHAEAGGTPHGMRNGQSQFGNHQTGGGSHQTNGEISGRRGGQQIGGNIKRGGSGGGKIGSSRGRNDQPNFERQSGNHGQGGSGDNNMDGNFGSGGKGQRGDFGRRGGQSGGHGMWGKGGNSQRFGGGQRALDHRYGQSGSNSSQTGSTNSHTGQRNGFEGLPFLVRVIQVNSRQKEVIME